ncbi:hypothetical protein [Dictyobacter kobayashii]|uniref:Uncharacterized protein n=1 Tax=Dictyobacter kobayashii TaxID=2014872 RepID=A0A402AD16_9CHLR|nr:hypothetical protein [Dictyobacter kobayashii]GCE16985.1 hypothetical protein KDK_07850 [Dictyobacter kobayashii]
MAELAVQDVVFALKHFHIDVDSKLRRRIEWSLGSGNYVWGEKNLKEELSNFILRRSRLNYSKLSDISLDDFLCEKYISFSQYRQYAKTLNASYCTPSIISTENLNSLDIDSNYLHYAKQISNLEEVIGELRNLGLSHIQCKMILGLGTKSYEKLKKRIQEQKKFEVSRPGRSEEDAWSFAKHIISDISVQKFTNLHVPPLTILETHQGIGDATFIYHKYGHVLGFENHHDSHEVFSQRVQKSGFFCNAREFYLKRFSSASLNSESLVFVNEEAISCTQGLKIVYEQGINFDVIDIDPWATSKPYFQDALSVIADQGLLMLTVGDQHPWPRSEMQGWENFGIDLFNIVLSEQTRQEWRRSWFFLRRACAWYMQSAAKQSICLLPIVLMRNFEPWSLRGDFSYGVTGIDRIYFLAKRAVSSEHIERVLQYWLEPLPFFNEMMVRTEVNTFVGPSGPVNFMSFSDDIWPEIKLLWPLYQNWLASTAKDVKLRWDCVEVTKSEEARSDLQKAIERAKKDKLAKSFDLADGWLKEL